MTGDEASIAPREVATLGDPERFAVQVLWDEVGAGIEPDEQTTDEATAGRAWLHLGGVAVWGRAGGEQGGFHWTWIDALEHLARVWARLRWEQRDPLALDGPLPELRRRARERWATTRLTDEALDREERLLLGFLEAHDLAAGLGGVRAAPVFVLRQGLLAVVSTADDELTLPLDEVLVPLERFASAIAARLEGLSDGRARGAVTAWERRNVLSASTKTFVRIATGLDEPVLDALVGKRSLADFFELGEAAKDNELLAVARLGAGRVARSHLAKILDHVRGCPARPAALAEVDGLAAAARSSLDELRTTFPFEQGHHAARWLRAHLKNEAGPVDPEALLAAWGVVVCRRASAAPGGRQR
jgi:hypothetical protein